MDWVHCNSCFIQPEPGLPFCLTNCGHMYCCKCLNVNKDGSSNKCEICKINCNYIQLVPDMKPEVKQYFKEPDEILADLMNVIDFQKHHRMRLISHWKNLSKKYASTKEEMKTLRETLGKMLNEMKNLHKENTYLKNALKSLNNQGKNTVFRTPSSTRVSSECESRMSLSRKGKFKNFIPSSKRSYMGPSNFLTPISISDE